MAALVGRGEGNGDRREQRDHGVTNSFFMDLLGWFDLTLSTPRDAVKSIWSRNILSADLFPR